MTVPDRQDADKVTGNNWFNNKFVNRNMNFNKLLSAVIFYH